MMNILTRYLLFELGKGYLLAALALTALDLILPSIKKWELCT